MHRVIRFFTDLHDGNHPYNVGDPFPRDGIEVTEKDSQSLQVLITNRGDR